MAQIIPTKFIPTIPPIITAKVMRTGLEQYLDVQLRDRETPEFHINTIKKEIEKLNSVIQNMVVDAESNLSISWSHGIPYIRIDMKDNPGYHFVVSLIATIEDIVYQSDTNIKIWFKFNLIVSGTIHYENESVSNATENSFSQCYSCVDDTEHQINEFTRNLNIYHVIPSCNRILTGQNTVDITTRHYSKQDAHPTVL